MSSTRIGWSEVNIYDSSPFVAWAAWRAKQGTDQAPLPVSPTHAAILKRYTSAEANLLDKMLIEMQSESVVDLRSMPASQDPVEFTYSQLKKASFQSMIHAQLEHFVKSLGVTLHCRVDLLRRQDNRLTVIEIKGSPAASPEHIKHALFCRYILNSMGFLCSDTVIVVTKGKGEERFRVSDFDRVLSSLLDKSCGFYRLGLKADPPEEPLAGQANSAYYEATIRRLRQIESIDLLPDLKEPDRLALLSVNLARLDSLAKSVRLLPSLKGKMSEARWEILRRKAKSIRLQEAPQKVTNGNWCIIDIVFVEARKEYQVFYMQRECSDTKSVITHYDFEEFWSYINRTGHNDIHYYGDEVRMHLLSCAEATGHNELVGVLQMLYGGSNRRLIDIQKCMQAHGSQDPFAALVLSYHLQDVVRCFPKLFPSIPHFADVALSEKLIDIVAVESSFGDSQALPDWQRKLRDAMGHRLGAIMVIRDYVSRLKTHFAKQGGQLAAIRIGTVDLFQGQEACVVVLSMGSSGGASGRLDFMLDPNRMNVALSRAQALTIVVVSEELLKSSPSEASQMVNLNRMQEIMEIPWSW